MIGKDQTIAERRESGGLSWYGDATTIVSLWTSGVYDWLAILEL